MIMFPGELSWVLQNVQQHPCPLQHTCPLSFLVVPTQNVSNHCSMFHEDQHCPSDSKITARGVPALSNDRKTNISHSPQTLALCLGMELRTPGQVALFPLGGFFWLTKVPIPGLVTVFSWEEAAIWGHGMCPREFKWARCSVLFSWKACIFKKSKY